MSPDDIELWDIVVVSHNSGHVLEREWSAAPQALLDRVICIENGDSPESAATARRLFQAVSVVENRGLSAANNEGFKRGTAPYVLFVNPDVRCDPNSLSVFRAWLDEFGGLVAPRLVDAAGAPQESCRDWPTLTKQLRNRIFDAQSGWNRRYLWPSTDRRFVPWLLGAVIAVRRADMELMGGWPEEYFLYFEDTQLSWRAWALDLPVALIEEERWYHAWERQSRSIVHRSTRHHLKSALRFYQSHPRLALGIPDRATRRSRRVQ